MMTDREKRLVLRGISIARGLLLSTQCNHHAIIKSYQQMLADAWSIDDGDASHREEFKHLVDEINAAIAAKYPDAVNRSGQRWRH